MKAVSAVAAVLVALLLGALPARGAEELDAAALQALHDEAARLFDDERFDEARAKYQACLDGGGPRELIYLVGRCHQERERWTEARDAYRAYLEGPIADPELRGRAVTQLQAVEQRLSVGTLVVQTTPFGARVLLDGAEAGRTPLEPLEVAPGPHELRVEAPDHEPATRTVTVEGGRRLLVSVELLARPPEGEEAGVRPGYLHRSLRCDANAPVGWTDSRRAG